MRREAIVRVEGVTPMSEHQQRVFCSCLELTSLVAPFLWFGLMFAALTDRIPDMPGESSLLVAWFILLLIPASFLTGLGWIILGHTVLGPVTFVARVATLIGALFLLAWTSSWSCEGRSCFGWAPISSYFGIILALALVPLLSAVGLYRIGRSPVSL